MYQWCELQEERERYNLDQRAVEKARRAVRRNMYVAGEVENHRGRNYKRKESSSRRGRPPKRKGKKVY